MAAWQKRAPLIIFLFAFLLYANTLNHGYALDDNPAIAYNKVISKGLSKASTILTKSFYHGSVGSEKVSYIYRPLTSLSFAADIELAGKNPSYHHFVNVTLYALGALFLFLLLRRLLKESNNVLPFIITLLYVAHPIHTEVVANIKSRDEIFSLLFGLAITLYALFKYLDTRQRKFLILSSVAYFIGIFSKENAITFLAVIPVTLYFFSEIRLRKILLMTLPYLTIAALFLFVRDTFVSQMSPSQASLTTSMLDVTNVNTDVSAMAIFYMLKYLKLLIIPHPLVWDYGFNSIPLKSMSNGWVIFSMVIHAAMGVYALLRIRKKDKLAYSIIFYYATLSIYFVLSLQTNAPMGERFLFIPSLGFCFVLGMMMIKLFKVKLAQGVKRPFVITLAVVLGLYSIKTIARNKDWKNTLTISQAAVKVHPNSVTIQNTYAGAYLEMVKTESNPRVKQSYWNHIIQACENIVRIRPDHAQTWYNLGAIYFEHGDFARAEKAFDQNLSFKQGNRQTYLGIADLFLVKEQYPATVKYYKEYIEQYPEDADAVNRLGIIYMDFIKEPPKALTYFLRSIEMDSNQAETYQRAGLIYKDLGQRKKAEEFFLKAVKFKN